MKEENFILSCVGDKDISEHFLSEIKKLLKEHHLTLIEIEKLTNLSNLALDLKLSSTHPIDHEKLKIEFIEISNRFQIDMALMEDNFSKRNRKLIVFDMDSTLIQAEVIDEMAALYGVGDQVKKITERAMNGELDFDQSLKERVALLKGLSKKEMEGIFHRLPLTPGAKKLIHTVKGMGYKTAIVSGGFRYFTESLKNKLGIDYAFGNELEFENDLLTGKVKGEIINAHKKAEILEELAKRENLSLDQVVAVGDGANDLLMLAKAGLGIAYHAKEKVRKEAKHRVNYGPLTTILYFLGISGDHLDETL
ncbi:MAG: phosphoserine phosphatase SerB [Bacteriovoracaceae bacterium]